MLERAGDRPGEDDPTWSATVEVDDTNDAPTITVIGANGATTRRVAVVRTAEVAQ